MSKIAVVYWSGTGHTEAMADAVADGAKGAGAEVSVFTAHDFKPEMVDIMMPSHSDAPQWEPNSLRGVNSNPCFHPVKAS